MGFLLAIILALVTNATKIVDPTGGNIVDPTGGNFTTKIVDPTGGKYS